MGKGTACFLAAFVFILVLQNALALDLDSFLVDTLDSTILALERDRATKDLTKSVTVPRRKISYKKVTTAGGKWSSRRRRYSVRKKVTKQKKKIPLNKNLQAINQIQNGMLEANAMRRSVSKNRLLQHIKQACNAKQFIFGRQMLGHQIYNAAKTRKRGRRSVNSPSGILDKIKNEIGDTKFNQLMAYDGGVTLAFALDTTGSMSDDIKQAKDIVKGIVTYKRTFLVDYVLSPFNDPISHKYHGPLTYMEETREAQFLELIKNVKHADGGDCDELAITGIQEIFSAPLQYQSPIYVLTDAGAKDATDEKIEILKELMFSYQSPVNFFLSTRGGCLQPKHIELYKSLADYIGGQVLFFSNKNHIGLTLNLIKKGLIGGSRIPVIQKKRRKRAVGNKQLSILVDDSIETLTATVLDSSNRGVRLYNPAGRLQNGGKIDTGAGALYVVEKPAVGEWKLVTPSNSFVTAKCVSLENIDFEYNFLVSVKIGFRQKVISSREPLLGKQATIIITVPAHAKTIPSSYRLQVVDVGLNTLRVISLKSHGKASGRYKGSFAAPSGEFRLVLKGKTKRNRPFSRLATGILKPKNVMIHVHSAPRGFAVTAGGSRTTIIFALHSYSTRDVFSVEADEPKKFIVRLPRRVFGRPGRMSLFTISFQAPRGAKKGQSYNVVITVVGKTSNVKSRKHVQLLVV